MENIFTFWEPQESMSGYLELCIETWKKFLPDYQINIINHKTIFDYLDKSVYDFDKLKGFSLPKQSDAIRCALLNKFGGIWLDADTIILSNKFKELVDLVCLNSDFAMIVENKEFPYSPHIGLIISRLPEFRKTTFFEQWQKQADERIKISKKSKLQIAIMKMFSDNKSIIQQKWDYLGNSIINNLLKTCDENVYLPLDNKDIKCIPETIVYPNIDRAEAYKYFYFMNTNSFNDYNINTSVICLHNSWTPKKYKKMNKKQFLNQNILLTKLLKDILNY